MRLSPEALAFIQAPDTVDFVTRATDAFFDYARSSNEVVVGQMLSQRYVLGYIKQENFHHLEEALGTAFLSSTSVVLGLLDRPALEAAGVSQVHSQPYLNLKGRGVLVGFGSTARRTSTPPWPPRTPTPWSLSGTRRATAPSWPPWPRGGRPRTSPGRRRTRRSSP